MLAPYLTVCTRNDTLSLMPLSTTLLISSEYSLHVVLLVELIIYQLLNGLITGHYLYSTTGYYQGYSFFYAPGDKDLSNIVVHATMYQFKL